MTSILQANLQHSKAASAVFCTSTGKHDVDFALIQEPWISRNNIAGLGASGGQIISPCVDNARTCIWVKDGLKCSPVLEFCSRDVTTIKAVCGSSSRPLMLASVYMPQEQLSPPPEEIRRLICHATSSGMDLVIGCDSNAHNTVWGCRDTNARGTVLLDYIAASGLMIANEGSEPTYMSRIGQSVIDLTLHSEGLCGRILNWHVSSEPSLSDHRHIIFRIGNFTPEKVLFRNPRRTNWTLFNSILRERVEAHSFRAKDTLELDKAALRLGGDIVSSFEESCPLPTGRRGGTNWWNSELASLKRRLRALFRRAKLSKSWDSYHRLLTVYNLAVRRAKKLSWENYCSNLESVKDTSRIFKVMIKDKVSGLGSLVGPGGEAVHDSREVLKLMAITHFPDCIIAQQPGLGGEHSEARRASTTRWMAAGRIVTFSKVRWAVNTLSPFKSPGPDQVRPICLQRGAETLLPALCGLFRASLALGHIPQAWCTSRIVFIPKPGKARYSDPKSFRPISLSSFLLKTLEKILLRHLGDSVLKSNPLHSNQHAYIPGRSCETALHHLVSRIEKAIGNKEVALGAFLDIQGAFDNTATDAVVRAARARGFGELECGWTESLLRSRMVRLSLHDATIEAKVTRGCPQGGVLSPLLWNLVADDLIRRLNDSGIYAQGYADDVVILAIGKFNSTITDLMNSALRLVGGWCSEVGLSINPSKVVAVPFTRRRNLSGIGPLKLQGINIDLQTQVKYLGVTLDRTLNWGPHLQKVIDRGKWSLFACRRLVGSSWGLQPRLMLWLYVSVVRPAMTYGSLVWWTKMESASAVKNLAGVQRLACLIITGAVSSCPGASLDCLLNLEPIDIFIKSVARRGSYHLSCENLWLSTGAPLGHARINNVVQSDVLAMPSDHMQRKFSFGKSFSVHLPSRDDWVDGRSPLPPCDMDWYTDGSKVRGGTGAGIHGVQAGVDFCLPMGVHPTVFQAEVTAIMECAREMLRSGINDASINIFSDSQAAIKALDSWEFRSKIVWDCFKTVSCLGRRNTVSLCWVPGHSGIIGNEAADRLANMAAAAEFTGPQPFCGISREYANSTISSWAREEHRRRWRELPLLKVSKLTLKHPSSRITSDLLRLSRSEIKFFTGLITGHGLLRKHSLRMGIFMGDPACRKCGLSEETADHLLFDCDGMAQARARTLGTWTRGSHLPPEELVTRLHGFIRLLHLEGF